MDTLFLLLMIGVSGFFAIIGVALRSIFRNKALDQRGYHTTRYYYKLAKISEAIAASAIVGIFIFLLFYVIASQ